MTNAPIGREDHTAVWNGSQMMIWGGYDDSIGVMNTGGRYAPSTNSWTATSTTNAPVGRAEHTALWTGSELSSGVVVMAPTISAMAGDIARCLAPPQHLRLLPGPHQDRDQLPTVAQRHRRV